MKRIVGSIILNQCSGKEWLLSEATVDLVRIYNYCSGDNSDDYVLKHLDTMVLSPTTLRLCLGMNMLL